MNLDFDMSLAKGYNSNSQITRVLTEDWFARICTAQFAGNKQFKRLKQMLL